MNRLMYVFTFCVQGVVQYDQIIKLTPTTLKFLTHFSWLEQRKVASRNCNSFNNFTEFIYSEEFFARI